MPITPDIPATEVAIVEMTNAFRKQHKLAAVRPNARLEAAARAYANGQVAEGDKLLADLRFDASLEKYREAVEAATKASSIHTWKEVCAACVKAEEYRLAQTCGLHIVKSPDHLEELIQMYARYGQYESLIDLLERSVSEQEQAHPGIYTQLAIAYSKYQEEKLMNHLEQYWQKMHVPHVLEACIDGRQWVEARFLYAESGEHGP